MPEGSDTEGQLEKISSCHALWWCMPEGSETEGQLEKISSCHTLEEYARRQ